MVQFWAKSVKPYWIYRKLNYFSFYFALWPCGQDHNFFSIAILGYNIVHFLAKSIKVFRIYRNEIYGYHVVQSFSKICQAIQALSQNEIFDC